MAGDNAATLWLQSDLNRQARNKALEVVRATGRALPCSVIAVNVEGNASLLTVKFEVTGVPTLPPLTLPKAESQWLRAPVQVGDVGMTVPCDTFLGGISGFGTGVADTSKDYGNMTTLAWVPIAAASFGPTPDVNKAWVNGPAGAVVSDKAQTVVAILDASGQAISFIVPSAGGVGVGSLFSTLPSTAAAITNADISTFQSALLAARHADQVAFQAAMVTAGVPNAATIILPTLSAVAVPSGSSIVRVAGG